MAATTEHRGCWFGQRGQCHWLGFRPYNNSLHATAQAAFLLKGCCLQSWLKIEMVSLAKLVYHRAGVCTPAKPAPGRAIERRVNSSVIRLAVFDNRKNQSVPSREQAVTVQAGGVKRRDIAVQRGLCSGQVVYCEQYPRPGRPLPRPARPNGALIDSAGVVGQTSGIGQQAE